MTDYAGETYVVFATAEDFDDTPLTPDDVDSVEVIIYDRAFTELVAQTAMTWDPDAEEWQYEWDTDAVDPGTYRAKVIVLGPGDRENFEYKRIRLARRPEG
jgi:hypothetical protein